MKHQSGSDECFDAKSAISVDLKVLEAVNRRPWHSSCLSGLNKPRLLKKTRASASPNFEKHQQRYDSKAARLSTQGNQNWTLMFGHFSIPTRRKSGSSRAGLRSSDVIIKWWFDWNWERFCAWQWQKKKQDYMQWLQTKLHLKYIS